MVLNTSAEGYGRMAVDAPTLQWEESVVIDDGEGVRVDVNQMVGSLRLSQDGSLRVIYGFVPGFGPVKQYVIELNVYEGTWRRTVEWVVSDVSDELRQDAKGYLDFLQGTIDGVLSSPEDREWMVSASAYLTHTYGFWLLPA